MDTHEVLVKARNLIEREGWAKGNGATWCASNALVNFGGGVAHEARAVLADVLDLRDGSTSLFRWNDAPGRTKEEVLAAFDKAIAATAPAPADPFPAGTPVSGVEAIEEVHA